MNKPTEDQPLFNPGHVCTMRSRRYPFGMGVEIQYRIKGTDCYKVRVLDQQYPASRTKAYALLSELPH